LGWGLLPLPLLNYEGEMAATKLIISNLALNLIGAKPLTTFGETTTQGNAITAFYNDIRDEVLEEAAWTFAQKRVALIDMTQTAQDTWVTGTVYAVDDIVYDLTLAKFYKCFTANTAAALFATDLAAVKWILYTTWATGIAYSQSDKVYNAGVEYSCLVNHTSGTFATDLAAGDWIVTEAPAWTDDGCDVVYYKPSDYLELNETNYPTALIKVEGARILSDTTGLKIGYTYSNDDPTLYSRKFTTAFATKLAAAVCFVLTNSTAKGEALLKLYYDVQLPSAVSSDSQQGSPIQPLQDEWENIRLGSGYSTTPAGQCWHPR
jgi:hypothetical protein